MPEDQEILQDQETQSETETENVEEPEEEPEEESEEAEEESEEEEQEVPKYQRPIFKEIKEKYPNFFKDFPDMREVYFREGKFSTIFPTVEDAEEALNKASVFDSLAQDLSSGSLNSLFDTLEQGGKDLLHKVVDNFLPAVYQRSPEAYFNTVGPIIGEFIKSIYDEGQRTGDDNLKAVALHAAKYGFGTTDLNEIGLKRRPVDPTLIEEKKKLETEKQRLELQRYQEVYGQVAEKAQKILLTEISKRIPVSDAYKRSAAIRDVFEKVNEVLSSDPRHVRLMNTLWVKARNSGYSFESRSKLISTLIGRAKQVMPGIVKEILSQIGEVEEKPTGGKATPLGERELPSAKGKVDWSKYRNEKEFLDAFIENKGKVVRK